MIAARDRVQFGDDESPLDPEPVPAQRPPRRGAGRRYVATFFRHWVIALIPVLVLPIAALGVIKLTSPSATVIANLWVTQDSAKHLSYTDPLATPATNVAAALQQLLQTQSFDLLVARESPAYMSTVATTRNRDVAIVSDLSKKVAVAPNGPDLVSISYSTKYPLAGTQLLRSIIKEAPQEIGNLNQAQAAASVAYYTRRKHNVQKALDRATGALGSYLTKHHIAPAQMADRELFDPTFAALYQTVQSAQVALQNVNQQLSAAAVQTTGNTIQVIDQPSAQPATTSKKQLALDLGIGIIVGLLLSAAFVVGVTAGDHSLRYTHEVPDLLGLPVLASVPYAGELRDGRSSEGRATKRRKAKSGEAR